MSVYNDGNLSMTIKHGKVSKEEIIDDGYGHYIQGCLLFNGNDFTNSN